jgi:1-acyl-sn-glycerol-3-phosphate acyltransferase
MASASISQYEYFLVIGNRQMDDWKLDPARDLGKSPQERLSSVERENALLETCTTYLAQQIVSLYLKLGHRLCVSGKENLPKSLPYVLVANHTSHLDALCLISVVNPSHRKGVFAIAAADTFFTNYSSSLFSSLCINALPLSRSGGGTGRAAMTTLRERLASGSSGFLLFPEGTRSRTGEMAAFRSGLGMLVAATAVPVVPVGIIGAFQAFPPQRKFPRFSSLELRIGAPIDFSAIPNDEVGWKEVAKSAEQNVRMLLGQ